MRIPSVEEERIKGAGLSNELASACVAVKKHGHLTPAELFLRLQDQKCLLHSCFRCLMQQQCTVAVDDRLASLQGLAKPPTLNAVIRSPTFMPTCWGALNHIFAHPYGHLQGRYTNLCTVRILHTAQVNVPPCRLLAHAINYSARRQPPFPHPRQHLHPHTLQANVGGLTPPHCW